VNAPTSDEVLKMRPQGVASSPVFEPTPYVNNTIKMFDYLRSKLGFDVEFVHDVHERVPPTQALVLAKAVEPFRLFFLEDAFAPEDVALDSQGRIYAGMEDGRIVRLQADGTHPEGFANTHGRPLGLIFDPSTSESLF